MIPGGRSARTGTTPRPSHRSTRIQPDPRLYPSPTAILPSRAERCFSSFPLFSLLFLLLLFLSVSHFTSLLPLSVSAFFPLLLSILLFSPVNLLVSRFIALQLIFRSSLALLSWINTLEQTSLALTSFHRLCAHWRRLRDCFRRYWCCYSCYRQCCQRSRRCRRRNDEILLPSLVLSIRATFRYTQPEKIDTFLE